MRPIGTPEESKRKNGYVPFFLLPLKLLLSAGLLGLVSGCSTGTLSTNPNPDGGATAMGGNPAVGGADDMTGGTSASGGASVNWSDEEWATLETLAPTEYPSPPADVSNRYADDMRAAALGKVFFNDPSFAGPLLDIDNDGGPNSLGRRGEPGKVSCAGCHIEKQAFSDTRSTFQQISLGAGWTHRRTPSLLDVGHVPLVTWAGRHSTLHSQVFAPFENPLEMNSSRLFVATSVADNYAEDYADIFGAESLEPLKDRDRFVRLAPESVGCRLTRETNHPRALPPDDLYDCHGVPGDGAEYDALDEAEKDAVNRVVINLGKAIAAYERTLKCGPSRFDSFVHGDRTALTAKEELGAQLFVGKAKCATCHSGPLLTDNKFHNVGAGQTVTREGILNDNDRGAIVDLVAAREDELGILGRYSDGDDGRLPESIGVELEGAFRTPSLRCVAARPTFMHTGLLETLGAVVEFFNRGGDQSGYSGQNELESLGLTRDEQQALSAFLEALSPD